MKLSPTTPIVMISVANLDDEERALVLGVMLEKSCCRCADSLGRNGCAGCSPPLSAAAARDCDHCDSSEDGTVGGPTATPHAARILSELPAFPRGRLGSDLFWAKASLL